MVRLVSLLISLGVLATACSQPSPPAAPAESGKPTAPGAAPAAAPGAQPAASPSRSDATGSAAAARAGNTVTYSIPSPNGFHLPILVGVEKGIFDKRNVKVDMVASGTSGVAMTQALLGGSLDFAPVTPATALSAQAKEPELMQILGGFVGIPYSIMVQPEIQSVEDLKGKTAGATALKVGGDIEAIRLILGEYSLKDQTDYSVVVSGGVAERIAAMQAKSVQFEAHLEPQISQMKAMGLVELLKASDYTALRQSLGTVLIAKKSFYQQNEDLAIRFVRGYLDTLNYLYDPKNKDEVLGVIKNQMKVEEGPAEALYSRNVLQKQAYIRDGRITEPAMNATVEMLKKLEAEVPENPMRFVDMDLVDKAAKL